MGETLMLKGGLRRVLTVGLIAVSASLLPAVGSFAGGNGIFGGVAQAACKWDGKPGPGGLHNTYDHWFFKAEVVSNWCYDGRHVTSRHSVPSGKVTTLGILGGWVYTSFDWAVSKCYTYNGITNHNCLTKAEYDLITLHTGDVHSICIETRIYGNGYHHRHITESEVAACSA